MARARNIKPGFYLNEELAQCSLMARYIFPGLWMLADRAGRMEDRPLRIKAAILPYDDANVSELLDELQNAGMIERYQHGNSRFIQIKNFTKHQTPHVKEAESTIPAPCSSGASTGLAPCSSGASTVQEQCMTDVSTVQAPCSSGVNTVLAPPDILITDSLNLIPESDTPLTPLTPASGGLVSAAQQTAEPTAEPERPVARTRDGAAVLAVQPEDVSTEVWDDFKALRKTKHAPLTETALRGIIREANKAGVTLQTALETCCLRGWTGFKADWMRERAAVNSAGFGFDARDEDRKRAYAELTGRAPPGSPLVRQTQTPLSYNGEIYEHEG